MANGIPPAPPPLPYLWTDRQKLIDLFNLRETRRDVSGWEVAVPMDNRKKERRFVPPLFNSGRGEAFQVAH